MVRTEAEIREQLARINADILRAQAEYATLRVKGQKIVVEHTLDRYDSYRDALLWVLKEGKYA